jgi:hypothetical protein
VKLSPNGRRRADACGSDDVTRDCLGRWSVERQNWEVSSELDGMRCEACDREIGSDGFDEVSIEADTRDIALAIASFLEGRRFSIHHENEDGGTLDPVADAAIEAIDASDPSNLVLMVEGGQPHTNALRQPTDLFRTRWDRLLAVV